MVFSSPSWRLKFHHDPSRLGDAQPKIDQPGHRRFRQDAVADRAHRLQSGHRSRGLGDRERRLPVHHPLTPRRGREKIRNVCRIDAVSGRHELLHDR
jgi:hypothetical protein